MDISTVIIFLKEVFASLMVLVMMFSPFGNKNGASYQAEKPDELISSFVVVSDIHVETNYPQSYQNFSDLLYGIKAGENIDAVVYTG